MHALFFSRMIVPDALNAHNAPTGYKGIRAKTDHARAFFFALDLVLRTSMHALFFSRMIVPDAPTGQRGTMIVPYALMKR